MNGVQTAADVQTFGRWIGAELGGAGKEEIRILEDKGVDVGRKVLVFLKSGG